MSSLAAPPLRSSPIARSKEDSLSIAVLMRSLQTRLSPTACVLTYSALSKEDFSPRTASSAWSSRKPGYHPLHMAWPIVRYLCPGPCGPIFCDQTHAMAGREAAPVVDDSCRHASLPQNSMVFTSWWFPKGRYVDAYLQKSSCRCILAKAITSKLFPQIASLSAS